MYVLKSYMYKRNYNDNRWYFKAVSFHSILKIQWVPINMGIQRRYKTNPPWSKHNISCESLQKIEKDSFHI